MIPDYLSELVAKIVVKIARTPFPRPIQCLLNRAYVKFFDIDMSQFETSNPCLYPTLNDLFIRYKKVVEFYEDEEIVISPADGLIVGEGEIGENGVIEVKGQEYSISRLVGEEVDLKGGYFVNIYLSPKDYHRFHVPIKMEILEGRAIPGRLKSVRPAVLEREKVYTENKRVVLKCRDWRGNPFYFIAVGAIIVGKIVINFDDRLSRDYPEPTTFSYSGVQLEKGEELGRFEFGSSILLLFPAGTFKYLNQKERVEVGDILGESF